MVGRTSNTREATETVGLHGQHQAMDKNNNITVRTGCRRPQSLERNRQSSYAGQQSNIICRNTFFHPLLHFLAVLFKVTINMSRAGQCNPLPTHVVVKYVLLGGPLGRGAPGTCPIGPMVNPALIMHVV